MHLNKIGAWTLAGLLAAGSLSLAACSSTKKTDVSAGNSTTSSTAAPASGSSSGDSSGSSGDTSGSGGSGSGNGLTTAECASAAAGYAKVLAAATAAVSGNTADAQQLQEEYDALGASIPDNLKGDYDTVAKAYAQFEKDIKGVSLTDPSSMSKLQQAEKDLTNSDVKASADKIDSYFKNNCQS